MKAALLLLLLVPAARAFEVPGYELVYSYPVETALEEKGVRLAQDVWPAMFDAAKASIDVEQFYVTPSTGEPLEASLQALERAARRGVKVRVILEKKFEKNSADGIARLKSIPGLDMRILEWSAFNGDGIVHAKFLSIDGGREAYVGSQNFDWRSLKHIHEMGLRVTDAAVAANVAKVFEHDWKAAGGEKDPQKLGETKTPDFDRSGRSYLVASPWARNPAGIGGSEAELVRLLGEAKDNVLIQLLDYDPTTYGHKRWYPVIDDALRDAAVRGVKVKLLVSHWNTGAPEVDYLKSLSLMPNVEIRIVTIPEASTGPIPFARTAHSKYMVADGKTSWVGTSNWAGGYLDQSRNLEVVVKDDALALRLTQVFAHVWGSAYTAPLEVLKAYPKPRR